MPNQISTIELSTPLQSLPGMRISQARRLARLGLRTAQDVLFLFPRDYEFPAPSVAIEQLKEGQEASLVGTITDAEIVSRTPGKSVFGAIVENETGAVRILFFNQPFRAQQLTCGRRVMISGTAKLNGLRMEFVHPQLTMLDEREDLPQPRILPVYPLTEGVKQSDLRRLARDVSNQLARELIEVMPESLRRRSGDLLRDRKFPIAGALLEIQAAIRWLHQPADADSLQAARLRLVFQELLVMQLALAMRRRKLTTDLLAPPLESSALIDARIVNRFPFELTGDQQRAIGEVRQDMARQFPMNRLLQGDVGSGKTVVAVYAMMLAVAKGHQAVLMAPTEILARQHFQTLTEMLTGSRVRIGLLCGSLTPKQRREVRRQVSAGEVDLLVGTHAVLNSGNPQTNQQHRLANKKHPGANKEIEFHRLGLCVIDEQHKFGVQQRLALRGGGVDPHYLVMSATPIPRSLAMTVFGDVDLSTLREKPAGRGAVKTYLADDGWKDRWWGFVGARLDQGRQAFVVAPRVAAEATDGDEDREDVASVEQVFENLCNGALSNYRVGLLHGRMTGEVKQATMNDFANGRLQVLVSTTVIEVGINVPNATLMTILGAQRFGLAQLHQLRGRVSRGSHTGHVCVFTDGEGSPEENERLRIFAQTVDGFELAEADFRMRGPGDLLGPSQSGLPPLRIANLVRDRELLIAARDLAREMIDEDPELAAAGLQELRRQVLRRYGKGLDLGDTA